MNIFQKIKNQTFLLVWVFNIISDFFLISYHSEGNILGSAVWSGSTGAILIGGAWPVAV